MPQTASLHAFSRRQRLRSFFGGLVTSSPARFAIAIFATLIAAFTLLFSLPIASASGRATPLHDAFFQAVSTICVTGLATVDSATYWSPFGNALIYIGVNIGGVGVLTLASILGFIMAGRLGLRAKLMAASDTNAARTHAGPVAEGQAISLGDMRGLLITVAASAVVIESVLTIALMPSMLAAGYNLGESAWYSAYYSAMAFTNSGFVPNVGGLTPFVGDYWLQSVLIVGVFIGSLGFPVIFTLVRQFRNPRRWSVHVKLTLVTTTVLLVLGAAGLWLFEFSNSDTFAPLPFLEQAFQSLFLSTMTRSGGFSIVNPGDLTAPAMFIASMLMFIGGGSASTAGGIKVTTLAVLFLAAAAEARGRKSIDVFGRKIPGDMLRLAVSVTLWGSTIVAAGCIGILAVSDAPLERVLFEVISAFATCGLSDGLTSELNPDGVYILAMVMFLGRVGTVTLAAALAASQSAQYYSFPEERPMVG